MQRERIKRRLEQLELQQQVGKPGVCGCKRAWTWDDAYRDDDRDGDEDFLRMIIDHRNYRPRQPATCPKCHRLPSAIPHVERVGPQRDLTRDEMLDRCREAERLIGLSSYEHESPMMRVRRILTHDGALSVDEAITKWRCDMVSVWWFFKQVVKENPWPTATS